MKQDTIIRPHQQYLKALTTWDKHCHSAINSRTIHQYSKEDLFKNFPCYKELTKILTFQHSTWQIDTIKKLLQRSEPFELIQLFIKPKKPKLCRPCGRRTHTTWNCAHAKTQAQLQRYKLSKNERKDNQVGDYACREPFQLLKDTLIPQQVFDLYEKEFIPFYC